MLTEEFKLKIVAELKKVRENFGGTDTQFAKMWGINYSVWSRIKDGQVEQMLKDGVWLNIGRELNVSINERKWHTAKTRVFVEIEGDINHCKAYSKAMMLVDECEIGKTYTAKYLSRTMKNCFYLDCSQCKTKQAFVRALAKAIGVDGTGKYQDIKANIKYLLKTMERPVIVLDEAGDLEYSAFLEIKEFYNATENSCGWYMMGADGLRAKVERGISYKKVGYREIFSRFANKFMSIIPKDKEKRYIYYKQLITDVLEANVTDKTTIPALISECMRNDTDGLGGVLRRAENVLIMHG